MTEKKTWNAAPMTGHEKKTWTAAPTMAPHAAGAPSDSPASLWADDSDALSAELMVGGGTIDEIARAASEHGIMITLTFIPATDEDEATNVSDRPA